MTAEPASKELFKDPVVQGRDASQSSSRDNRDMESIMEGKSSKPLRQVIPLETEALRMKQKCKDLKQKICELEKQNQVRAIGVSRAKDSISRLRFEYSSLLELIEIKANQLPLPELKKVKLESINAESIESLTLEDIAQLLSKSPADLSHVRKILPNALGDLIAERQQQYINSASHGDATSARNRRKRPLPTPSAASIRKKMRDPREPKRPTNAYLFFCDAERERVKAEWAEEHPDEHIDLSKAMTEAWKKMSDENKKPYFEMYEKDKERYQKAIKEYASIKERELLEGTGTTQNSENKPIASNDDGKPIINDNTGISVSASASVRTSVEPETPSSQIHDTDIADGDTSHVDESMDETIDAMAASAKSAMSQHINNNDDDDEDDANTGADADIDEGDEVEDDEEEEEEEEEDDDDEDDEADYDGRDDSVISINHQAILSEGVEPNSEILEHDDEDQDVEMPQIGATIAPNLDLVNGEGHQNIAMKPTLDPFLGGDAA